MEKRVFNFSGGKTSALMTLKYFKGGDLVIIADTGREHEKTYKFIMDFEAYESIPVTKIAYDPTAPNRWRMLDNLGEYDAFRALLENRKFKTLPNRVKRICTDELKIKTAKRFLRDIGVRKFENFIGFRADEPKRVKNREQKFVNVIDKFPLFDDGTTKQDVNDFWANKPYNLQIPAILGNCTMCFMKGENALLAIMREYPEMADVWIEDERLSKNAMNGKGRTYLTDANLETLKKFATNNLFKEQPLDKLQFKFKCGCGT